MSNDDNLSGTSVCVQMCANVFVFAYLEQVEVALIWLAEFVL